MTDLSSAYDDDPILPWYGVLWALLCAPFRVLWYLACAVNHGGDGAD